MVVARDSFVKEFKKKTPQWDKKKRLEEIRNVPEVDEGALADKIAGSYGVIKKCRPDIMCVGHDQSALEEDLKKRMASGKIRALPIIRLPRYNREKNGHEN
ncbi:MAG: hypothetical protein G01um101433_956 [Parcubacteria group bacterium Gr01-1014_33]|nr:MAG: hypothetical protein G01um101433_956 [Parcubacteria group bacterium Gr01-1014_33]